MPVFAAVLPKGRVRDLLPGRPVVRGGVRAWHPGGFSAPRLFTKPARFILDPDDEDTRPRGRYFTAAPVLLWNGRPRMR
ncbi:hypothetical protein AOZ06_09250 [Kibdelosporangium phytohabitans]|uniref:Uncharacterized protein n=1 Tax=Kibdelosporangium phytohabitans TaxID=860235 RepID=A0A0N7F2Y0_9PSEU|nr:hypothetical protein AOZ06_09250 [Kibdelosporangium phytohabitans]